MKLKFNIQPFVEAYRKVDKANICQPQTVLAHQIVLHTDYLEKHAGKVLKAIQKVVRKQETAAIQSFIGQLALKLPGDKALKELDLHDRVMAKICMSKLIVEIMTYGGYLSVQNEVRSVIRDGKRFHIEVPYIQCGGQKIKRPAKYGLATDPVVNQTHVNGRKLNGDMKHYLKRKASMQYRVSDWCTEEVLRHGFELSKHYQFREKKLTQREDKKLRFEQLVHDCVSLVGTVHRMPMKFDGRLREYYEFQTQGLRPQGKQWETLLWDQAVPEFITEAGADNIAHMIYCLRYGKTPKHVAKAEYSFADHAWAKAQEPLEAKTEKEFGERLLLRKLAAAQDMYDANEPCPYLFGLDLTNSGLIMASCLFKAPQMANACNLGTDTSQVADSHIAFREAYGLDISRDDTKDIHTALLHGGSAFTTQKQLERLGIAVSIDDIESYNRKAYGDPVSNIDMLANWGKELMDNFRSVVSWKMPDGFVAHHKAFIASVPISVRCVTPAAKKLWCESTVVTDTPLQFHADGTLVYGYGYSKGYTSAKGTVPHIRGFYANMIHSFDAYVLRCVSNELMDRGATFLTKHDDYMTHPNYMDVVNDEILSTLRDIRGSEYLDSALNDIVESGSFVKPEVIYGDWQEPIENRNFLMP